MDEQKSLESGSNPTIDHKRNNDAQKNMAKSTACNIQKSKEK